MKEIGTYSVLIKGKERASSGGKQPVNFEIREGKIYWPCASRRS